MKIPSNSTAIRFAAILVAAGAVIGLIVFSMFLINKSREVSGPAGVEQQDLFSSLFPFFGEGRSTRAGLPASSDQPLETSVGPVPHLRKVYGGPTAGATIFGSGASTTIRYIEKETGHIFDTPAGSFDTVRVSNTTIPGIENVVWVGPSKFIAQYLGERDTVQNFLGEISSSSPERALSGRVLPAFARVAVSSDGGSMLTVTSTSGGMRVELTDLKSSAMPRVVATSPLRGWLPLIAGKKIYVETAPAAGSPGYLYEVGPNQTLKKVAGGTSDFMALPSPNGRYILYNENAGDGVVASVLDRESGKISRFPLPLLAAKCVWSSYKEPFLLCGVPRDPAAVALDEWLLGYGNFEDDLWAIDPAQQVGSIVLELSREAGAPLDTMNLSLSEDGDYALFVNKADLSLWSFKLSGK